VTGALPPLNDVDLYDWRTAHCSVCVIFGG
jgi:hypothetical protein